MSQHGAAINVDVDGGGDGGDGGDGGGDGGGGVCFDGNSDRHGGCDGCCGRFNGRGGKICSRTRTPWYSDFNDHASFPFSETFNLSNILADNPLSSCNFYKQDLVILYC